MDKDEHFKLLRASGAKVNGLQEELQSGVVFRVGVVGHPLLGHGVVLADGVAERPVIADGLAELVCQLPQEVQGRAVHVPDLRANHRAARGRCG